MSGAAGRPGDAGDATPASASSFFACASECASVLKDFCRGQRAKAKKALQGYIAKYPKSFLPHRYMARLLYHESARVEIDQQGGTPAPHRRLELLHRALTSAKVASELEPGSLSSAALRATLLVNLLVEESALQGGFSLPSDLAAAASTQPSSSESSSGAFSNTASADESLSTEVAWYQLPPEARCERVKTEFRSALAHCVRTLEHPAPLLVEPVITISDSHARTCDPCCLRVQDSVVEWVKQDNWQRIVAEKRSVLACMHQVLESCHTLLDSTHIPIDSVVRLLQSVLRPHQQDLQVWASQLLLSKGAGVGLDESQQENRFETQAAVSELLRMLRPGPGSGPAPTLCRPGEESSGSGATGEMHVQQQRQAPPQPQLHQQHMQQQHQQQVLQGQHGPGQAGRGQGAAMQGQGAHGIATLQQQAQHLQQQYQHQQQYHQQLLQQQQQQQQQQLPPGPRAGPGQHAVGAPMRAPPPPADMHSRAVVPAHGGQAAPPPPPPPQDLAPCLSAEQEWDDVREGSQGQPGPGAGVGARRAGGKAKNRGAKGADGGRGPRGKERSRYERFMDVETFWRTTTPEQRAALLKVPMAALLKGVRREQGPDAVDELIEGLVLLREQGNRAACYWLCPVCEQKFHSSRDFLGHVELVHEGLAVQDNKYVCCSKCQQDVVGMYYTSTRSPGYHLCFRCYTSDAAVLSAPDSFEKVFMRPSAGRGAWSHSDFMSTRDSFSSLSERSTSRQQHHHQGLPHGHALPHAAHQQHQAATQHQQQHGMHQQHQQQVQVPQQQQVQHMQQQAQGGGVAAGQQACRHHPNCPHHGHAGQGHGQGQGTRQSGTDATAAHAAHQQHPQHAQQQHMLTFGEASDEWLAPISFPGAMPPPMAPAVPDPRSTATAPLSALPHGAGAAGGADGGPAGRRQKRSSGGSSCSSSDSLLGPVTHSRSLSEPPNQAGVQEGKGGRVPAAEEGAEGPGQAGGAAGGSGATWRSWWPTRLMQGWAGGKGASAQQQGQAVLGVSRRESRKEVSEEGSSGAEDEVAEGAAPLAAQQQRGYAGYDGGGSAPGSVPGSYPQNADQQHSQQLQYHQHQQQQYRDDPSSVAANAMVSELMTRLREIYLTDRDLGDMSLGSITQFVYRKLGVGATAEVHLASCPPATRGVLVEFLSQPSIVFQRPQSLAVVLGLLPLSDLQMVAAYAVRQHEEAVSGVEAAARDIAAGSGEDMGEGEDGDEGYDPRVAASMRAGGMQYGGEAAAAVAGAGMQHGVQAAAGAAGAPRARRRLRYTSRRTGQGQAVSAAPTGTATPPLPPHAGGAAMVGGSHALHLRRAEDDLDAEEVSEEDMASAGDLPEYTHVSGAAADHAMALRAQQQHQQMMQVHQQLRRAGGGGGGAACGGGMSYDASGLLCDNEASLGDSMDPDDEQEGVFVEDVEEEGEVTDVTDVTEEGEGEEELTEGEEDGVSLGPDEEEEEEDGPCVSLFVVAGDVELGFDRLITQMWGGGADSDEANQLEGSPVNANANSNAVVPANGKNAQQQQSQQRQGRNGSAGRNGSNSNNARQPSPTSRGGNAAAATSQAAVAVASEDALATEELSAPREDEPYLRVADWWLQHLRAEGGGGGGSIAVDDMRVLRWVYGNIINVQSEEFCARQRELRGGRDRDAAILELYDEVAAVWRSLQAVTDKRSRLEALRRAARGHFAVVKRLEEAGGHATLEQATEFLDAVLSGYCTGQQQQQQPHAQGQGQAQVPQQAAPTSEGGDPAAPASDGGDADGEASEDPDGGTGGASSRGAAAAGPLTVAAGAVTGSGPPGPLLYLCERAVEVVRRHPALAQEPSQRYAAALLERELSVLALVEVMVAAEAEEAARERGVAEEALKRHRAEHREAEAEYQRVQAEGPASHRKKDLLDKATKEAEHREQLRELAARLASLADSIAADEASKAKWTDKQEESERELAQVRDQMRQTSARRASLLDVCATLDVPFVPSPPPPPPPPLRHGSRASDTSADPHGHALPHGDDQHDQDPLSDQEDVHHLRSQHHQLTHAAQQQYHQQQQQHDQDQYPHHPAARQDADDCGTLPPSAALTLTTASSSAESALAHASMSSGTITAMTTGSGAGPGSITAADIEWRATRLECLMYRVLWVSEAVKMFQHQYSPRQSTHHYDLFIRATHWAKQLSEEYEESIRAYCCELERLRARLRDVAAVDLGYEIGSSALEVVRRRIESSARAAREAASLTLLKELEEEEERLKAQLAAEKAARKAAQEAKEAAAGGGAAAAKKAGANKKAGAKAQDPKTRAQKERERELAKQAEDEARRRAEEEDKERVAAARRAREAALEAELERRRRELEELEAQREAEAIRAAQEASLREQRERAEREKERAEREKAEKERQAAAAAAAAAAAQQQQKAAQAAAAAPPPPPPPPAAPVASPTAPVGGKHGVGMAQQLQARKQAAGVEAVDHAPGAKQKRNAVPANARPKAGSGGGAGEHSPTGPGAALANGGGPGPFQRGTPAKAAAPGPAAHAGNASQYQPHPQVAAAGGPVQPLSPTSSGGRSRGSPPTPGASQAAPGNHSDVAAAAAVAAATAGIVKGGNGGSGAGPSPTHAPAGPVRSPSKGQHPGGGANSAAARRQQQGTHHPAANAQHHHGHAGHHPTHHSQLHHSAARSVLVHQHGAAMQPQTPPPQQPHPHQLADMAARSTSGPLSPGADFPPLPSATAATTAAMAVPPLAAAATPAAPQAPVPAGHPAMLSPVPGAPAPMAPPPHAMAPPSMPQQQQPVMLPQQPQPGMQPSPQQQLQQQQRRQPVMQPQAGIAGPPGGVMGPQPMAAGMLPMAPALGPQQHPPAMPSPQALAQHQQHILHMQQMQQQQQAALMQQMLLSQPSPRAQPPAAMPPPPRPAGSSMFDPFAENPLLRALSTMDPGKPSMPPSSPGGIPGAPPPGCRTPPPAAGAMAGSPPPPSPQAPALPQLPMAHPHDLGPLHHGVGSSSAPETAADDHILSIMSMLDADGSSPAPEPSSSKAGSSGKAGGKQPSPSGGAANARGGAAGSGSPQRAPLPSVLPLLPGGPAGSFGYGQGVETSPGGPGAAGQPMASPARPGQAGFANGPGGPPGVGGQPQRPQGPQDLPPGLPGLAAVPNSAFNSGIWRQGSEQLGSGLQLPGSGVRPMLGLGLGLGGSTWGTAGLPGAPAPGAAAGGARPPGQAGASPRKGADWSAAAGGGGAAAGGAAGNGGGSAAGGVVLPDSLAVDSIVASLPSTLLPTSLDSDPAPPASPAGNTSGLAPTAAPFYPAALRGKAPQGQQPGGPPGGMMPAPLQQQQQQHMMGMGGMGMGPMGMPGMVDGAAAWMGAGGMGPGGAAGAMPAGQLGGKQGGGAVAAATAGAMAGAAAAAAAAGQQAAMMLAAAASAMGPQGSAGPMALGPGMPGGMGAGTGALGRYGLGLYNNGDGVNWSHGGLVAGAGGPVGAQGVPAGVAGPVRGAASSSTWAPYVPGQTGQQQGQMGVGQQQQQASQQQQQQQAQAQAQQMAGWPRGQRWRN